MSDLRIRELERRAKAGDPDAASKLESLRKRHGIYPPLPKNLYKATLRPRYHKSGDPLRPLARPNRNMQRLRKHKQGICNPKSCRYCRRHGGMMPG